MKNLKLILAIVLAVAVFFSLSSIPNAMEPKCTEGPKPGINWSGCDLTKKNLKDANLQGANMENTNLSGVNLQGASLQEANFKNANLKNTQLQDASLQRANLENANLRGALWSGADMKEAKIIGTTTEGTIGLCLNNKICQ